MFKKLISAGYWGKSLSLTSGSTGPRVVPCMFFSGSGLSQSQYPPNSSIIPTSINNRNPRNLEKLRIGDKPDGWRLERESKSYWNRITLDISAKHVSASVKHFLGKVPIYVSTKEWCIKKYLYNTNDASAARLVGQVLAQRCLQAGITEVACFFPEASLKKEKVDLFLRAVEDGGVALTEPKQVPPDHNVNYHEIPETPWEVHEDIDETYGIASKLPGCKIRARKIPNARIFHDLNNPKQLE